MLKEEKGFEMCLFCAWDHLFLDLMCHFYAMDPILLVHLAFFEMPKSQLHFILVM
jgi:hypothetical protein